MMASLSARLFAGLAMLVLVAGLTAGGLAFNWAFDEAIEFQDSLLIQIGALAINSRLHSEATGPGAVDAEAQVTIDEIEPAPADTPDASSIGRRPDGLHTISRAGKPWRLLLRTRPDGTRVAIGQPTANRDEIARDSALRTVLPLAALIPCLLLLVGIVIRQTFRPVARLAAQLDLKTSDHLEPLPSDDMPSELLPFIASINRLLDRIRILFEQQGRFVAAAAHELRTPITALSLQAENLDSLDMAPQSRKRLATLKTGIGRTGRLLEQLLTLARYDLPGATAMAPAVPLDGVVKQTVADLLPLAQARGIDLGFTDLEPVMVRADATALAVVIRNLVDNALRHSGDGARVDLSLSRVGDFARFVVEDEGPGIDDAELGRIFEPFYRGGRAQGEGSGLGLAIVRRILDGIAGSIALENVSEEGRSGLRAVVAIPIVKA